MSVPIWEVEWEGYVRELLFPVVYESDPSGSVERVVDALRADPHVVPERYIGAARAALASDAKLSSILPSNHAEDVVREYLALLVLRLGEHE